MLGPEAQTPDVGFALQDIPYSEVRKRVLVADIEVLPPQRAAEQGFSGPGLSEGAITIVNPRLIVHEEHWQQVLATDATRWPIQMLRLPRELGEMALSHCPPRENSYDPPNPLAYEELVPGLWGTYQLVRDDPPGRLSTTLDYRRPSALGDGPRRVGFHIDAWRQANRPVRYGIANMGPGPRYHWIVPQVIRENIASPFLLPNNTIPRLEAGRRWNGPNRYNMEKEALAYVKRIGQHTIRAFGVRLNPPADDYIEACVGVPVSEVLHDGTTHDCQQHSVAAIFSVDMERLGYFPSAILLHDT